MFLWMQFSQNTNIFANLFYRNTKQFFRIWAYIVCLICFCIQHQKNVIHIHWQLLKKLVSVPDLCVLSSKAYPVFLNNKADKKGGNTEQNRTNKKHCTALQAVHTGIDNICLYKSQKYPVLNIWFFIDQIIVSFIQIYQHRIGASRFKLLRKLIDLFFRHIGMLSQNTKEIVHIPPWLRRMIDHNTAIRMNNKALGISIESRNVQHIYDIRVFIGNGNCIIFKSLINSMGPGSSKNKQLRLSGNCCIRYHIISLPDLLFNVFL